MGGWFYGKGSKIKVQGVKQVNTLTRFTPPVKQVAPCHPNVADPFDSAGKNLPFFGKTFPSPFHGTSRDPPVSLNRPKSAQVLRRNGPSSGGQAEAVLGTSAGGAIRHDSDVGLPAAAAINFCVKVAYFEIASGQKKRPQPRAEGLGRRASYNPPIPTKFCSRRVA
jgi:hypothetical protein